MGIAEISNRKIVIGKQSALGTAVAAGGTSKYYNHKPDTAGGLKKDTFSSDSIRTDQTVQNARHGLRSVDFTLSQELQLGGHTELIAAACRAAWASGSTTGAQTNIGINTSTRTISRAAGSFITDGFKVGDIVRAAGFATTANNGKNLRLLTVTALAMTYAADAWLTGAGMATEAAGASVTITVPGKKVATPSSGHTKDYFTVEDWHSDVPQGTLMTDCVVGSVAIDVNPGAQATIKFGLTGLAADLTRTSAYFSAATAASTGSLLAGPEGKLNFAGNDSAVVSGLQINMAGSADVKAVVGSKSSPDVFRSPIAVSGSLSALFDGGAILTAFDNEVENVLYVYMFANATATADFLVIKVPNAKINGADKSQDGPALQISGNFTGDNRASATAVETSAIVFMDSTV